MRESGGSPYKNAVVDAHDTPIDEKEDHDGDIEDMDVDPASSWSHEFGRWECARLLPLLGPIPIFAPAM